VSDAKTMEYTAEDYNVTVFRGDIHPITNLKLWGIRKYKGKKLLDWRTQDAWTESTIKKKKRSRAYYQTKKDMINSYMLEFDHIDPATKLKNVCDMTHKSWDDIQAEIDKCRILCKPCHTKHTGTQNRGEYYEE
jgi:hypothetical protein